MTMNSMAAVEEVVVEVAEAEEEEVVMIIMAVVTKGIRWPSQGIMMTTTAKEDRYRSSNEWVTMPTTSTSQASKKIKIH